MKKAQKQTLRQILGIKSGMRIFIQHPPADFMKDLGDLEDSTSTVHDPTLANFFIYFVSTNAQLFNIAEKLQHLGAPSQTIWIFWPIKKPASKHSIDEQDLRDSLLPIGLFDSKQITVSTEYSGMKFVWRKK